MGSFKEKKWKGLYAEAYSSDTHLSLAGCES